MGRLALNSGLRAYAHTPTVELAPAFVNEKSTSFDGNDDGYRMQDLTNSDRTTFFTADGYTISAWVKIPTPAVSSLYGWYNYPIFRISSTTYYHQIVDLVIYRVRDTGSFVVAATEGLSVDRIKFEVQPSEPATDQWVHLAVTSDTAGWGSGGGTMTVYFDGASAGTATGTAYAHARNLQEIALAVNGSTYLEAEIDEVSYWTTHMDSTAIGELINGSKPADLAEHSDYSSHCLLWYRMGDDASDSSSTAVDQQGNHNLSGLGSPAITTDVPA